jgi:hypothetical protein
MLLDSDLHVIQIPYLDVVECDRLLEEYRYEQTSEGPIDNAIIEQIQSDESESDSISDLLEKFKSDKRGQSSFEEDVFGYPDFTGPEGEG